MYLLNQIHDGVFHRSTSYSLQVCIHMLKTWILHVMQYVHVYMYMHLKYVACGYAATSIRHHQVSQLAFEG